MLSADVTDRRRWIKKKTTEGSRNERGTRRLREDTKGTEERKKMLSADVADTRR